MDQQECVAQPKRSWSLARAEFLAGIISLFLLEEMQRARTLRERLLQAWDA